MSYRTSLPLHETEDDKPKKKRERGRDIVQYKVPGKKDTYRITTRRKMNRDLRKHEKANKRMTKVKKQKKGKSFILKINNGKNKYIRISNTNFN